MKYPNYIKIDVDGSELSILNGANEIIDNVKEILIEVDQNNNSKHLIENYFVNKNFKKKIEETSRLNASNINAPINQIWVRNEN